MRRDEMSRRFFVKGIGMMAASTLFGCRTGGGEKPLVRLGLVTDCHYADIPLAHRPMPIGDASYRESCAKLAEAVAVFNRERPDFAIELGDFKDQGRDKAETLSFLERIEGVFAGFAGPRYHVLGNHDMDLLTKEDFFSRVENGGAKPVSGHYSFTVNGVKVIVLDGCYNAKNEPYAPGNWIWHDARVPPFETEWFASELESAPGKAVVCVHQRVDSAADEQHLMRNAAEIRTLMERSGKVCAVFSGHQHSGGCTVENGILYYSLRALVLNEGAEENSYALAEVYASGRVRVIGYRKARTRSDFRAPSGELV